jgi:TRAP-type C4-dicarboxylate transport system substrate-binding protein
MEEGTMKTSALVLVLAMAALLLAPGAAPAQPVKLTYANFPPAPTFPCVQMERWKAEVEKRTGGKVQVDTFPGGTLLGPTEMLDGVIAGQADIGCLSTAYFPGRLDFSNAAALPLGIPNARVGSLVVWEMFRKYQPQEFADVKVLTMFCSAPSNIMSRKRVASLADIENMSLRASGGALDILKAWGANGVGMPMSATPEALQKGVVIGLFSSLEVLKDFKFAELCKYATITNTVIYPFAVVMNRSRWEALPADVRKVMDDLGAEQAEWTGTYMDNHVKEAVTWSKETQQVEFVELSAADKAQWDARLQGLTAQWIEQAKAKGMPAEAIVEDIRKLTQQLQ